MFSHAMAKAIVDHELEQAGVRYAWVIAEEYEVDWDTERGRWGPIEGGEVTGPGEATDEEIELARTRGKPFRLDYGGDGPALRGRMWASDAEHARHSRAAYAPLDDFGRGSHGCVSILYRNERGEWGEV